MPELITNPTLDRLLSTTEQIIRERGCRRTTLQEIMNRSGLSKGAIYHYVTSKDELFGLIFKSRMEAVNTRFFEAVKSARRELDQPLKAITEGLRHIHNEKDVSNQIFIYLLSQQENPAIREMLREIYDHSVRTAAIWIETGQKNGVIPDSLDARKMADMFVVLSYGLRARSMISTEAVSFSMDDFHELMHHMLSEHSRGG
ncbi:hypothetical protein DNHGIG_09810 [Collibacillus ludicampi]|uniref:HTH tetR-type domain-containing protein n=1 Tax=Collibacillus ludicampi TaxID=2771369 RepID=A0AAV4LDD7_9BACL|nr:TetR/AcrR family transcriptional regulator [Collibacillus ludicampi]GIM45432.1 hypothetical protein DNHGIG_09810 [Collibacillus ludicampi]